MTIDCYLKEVFHTEDDITLEGYSIVGSHGWHTYSEYYEEIIIEKDNLYYLVSNGYCVMSDDNTNYFQPDIMSEDEVLEKMIEWEALDKVQMKENMD